MADAGFGISAIIYTKGLNLILYDKKGNFLGMGQRELSSLGFQDFDEFKSRYNDLADLFVNRPGYISKFKNFSWIDYALHSGTPNRNIIIKNTNGQELEASLEISEIFLMQELNESSGIYNIKIYFSFEKNMQNHNRVFKEDDFDVRPHVAFEAEDEDEDKVAFKEEEPVPLEIPISDTSKEAIKIEDFNDNTLEPPKKDISIKIEDDIELPILDFDDTKTSDEPIEQTEQEYVPNTKLKIDLDIDESKILQESKIEIPLEEFEDMPEEETFEEINIKEKESINEDKPILAYDFELDIAQIAQDTQMDLEDIALFLNAFIKESKQTLDLLNSSLDTFNATTIKNMMIKLKGIATRLKIHSIIHTLDAIIASTDKDDINDKMEILKIQIEDIEEKLF